MEIAKFMFKFDNQMLPDFFNNYFTKLDIVHNYNTRQKTPAEFFQYSVASESRRKILHYIGLKVSKNVAKEFHHCSFPIFRKYFKINIQLNYECCEIVYNYRFDIGVL